MKTLLLLRHAKALPAADREPDRERSLSDRGHRDSRLVGTAISEAWLPDLILFSPSVRTTETMEDVVATFATAPKTIVEESLYGGSARDYLAAVARHGARSERLLVIGHNPSVHETAVRLAKAPGAKMSVKFPTAALAVLAFETDDWAKIGPGKGDLVRFLRPKDLGARDADD